VITGVHHFALTVSDLETSLAFYRDLGFNVVSDREVEGGYVEEITGVPGAKIRLAHLSGYGHNLELLQYKRPLGANRAGRLQDTGRRRARASRPWRHVPLGRARDDDERAEQGRTGHLRGGSRRERPRDRPARTALGK
jgi:catechol 2,3-dioxygenase-like lactoylglutathione lyase family enzyme